MDAQIMLLFCLTLVAIVALGSGGNNGTANKAIDALKSIVRKK